MVRDFRSGRARHLLQVAACVVISLLSAMEGGAQVVRGSILDESTGAAIGGAAVVLLDSSERQVTGTITRDGGEFVLRAPSPGRFRIRVERIGLESILTPAFDLRENQVRPYVVHAEKRAISLEGLSVTARSRSRCVVRPREGVMTHRLWEEARKALNAIRLTSGETEYRFRIRQYERELDPVDYQVMDESTRTSAGASVNPFVSVSPDVLAARGYVEGSDGTLTFHAPDAGVLLSDSFLDRHCFHPRQGEQTGLVGLAFEPARRPGRPDVRGTLWLDSRTSELRYLEYSYVGLSRTLPAEQAGGRVEFERMPSGSWINRRWYIRMPRLAKKRFRWDGASREEIEVVGVKETGGEVLDVATLGGGRIRGFTAGILYGSVYDSIHAVPLAGARVYLEGTGHVTETDRGGTFRLERLPAGTYSLRFSHSVLDSLRYVPEAVVLRLTPEESTRVDLAVPPAARVRTASCPRDSTKHGILYGTVLNRLEPIPIPHARVTVTWEERNGPEVVKRRVTKAADRAGRYLFCDLPSGTPLVVESEALGQKMAELVSVQVGAGEPVEQDLRMRVAGMILRLQNGRTLEAELQPVRVRGRILDSENGDAVEGARVRIVTKTNITKWADRRGRFFFEPIPPGQYTIEVRHSDYRPYVEPLVLSGGSVAELRIRIVRK